MGKAKVTSLIIAVAMAFTMFGYFAIPQVDAASKPSTPKNVNITFVKHGDTSDVYKGTWSKVSKAKKYQCQVKMYNKSSSKTLRNYTTTRTYTDFSCPRGTKYTHVKMRVRSINNAGKSSWSKWVTKSIN